MRHRLPQLRLAAALFGAALGVGVGSAPAQAQAHGTGWTANDEDSPILELRSGQYKLGEPMRGYQIPAGVCVDLADLIQALDLPVRLDKKSRRATGWLFAEDQRFVLDRDSNTVQTMNGNRALGAGAVYDTPEGWCVDLKALSGWMGVRFRADLSNLAVVLESDRKLPFLEAIERKSRAARLREPRMAEFDLAKLPQAQLPYQGWRMPSVDVQVQAQWARQGGASVQFETVRGALTGQTAYGRGAFVSNQPLNRPGRFGVTSLAGSMPVGWDAELYRNGELRAYQADRGDGRYRFDNIELLWGENDFEVVLYGPQGQIKRERSSMPVGIDSIPAGKTLYWAGIVDAGRDLIDLTSNFTDPHTGWRWGVGVERGIDRRTTVGIEY